MLGSKFPVVKDPRSKIFAPAEGFELVYDFSLLKIVKPFKIYRPKAPKGYIALGCVIAPS